ncbi:WG repeat-containing protein [Prolixibacter denitrificans]|uniref:WG repeat-containing protein n=1 Tax=Prolixibacter denitrificans TaxID=1541063 RepID=UPI0014741BC3|nr:WG repeat-containing protein [Prolixibacter denitrificans]
MVSKYGDYGVPWALIKKNGKFGFIDQQGNVVVAPQYESIEKYGAHGVSWALVEKDGKLGFIDKSGKEVVKPQYEMIDHFGTYGPPWALVRKDGRLGFIDQEGNEDFSIAATGKLYEGHRISFQQNINKGDNSSYIDRAIKEITRLRIQSPSALSDNSNDMFALILRDRNLDRYSVLPQRTKHISDGTVKYYSPWNVSSVNGRIRCNYHNNESDSDMIAPKVNPPVSQKD